METLKKTWITDGLIDSEYKRYIMLAYLQKVGEFFRSNRLYPKLAEVIAHHENLLRFKQGHDALAQVFPKDLKGLNLEEQKLEFHSLLPETEEMKHIREIVEHAIPAFEQVMHAGKSIYDFVEEHLHIEAVGVLPLYKGEGYVMLHDAQASDVLLYRYELSRVATSEHQYRTLKTEFIRRERKSLAKTFENMKVRLIQEFPELPNPACFVVQSDLRFPLVETYLPVSKRMLMRALAEAA